MLTLRCHASCTLHGRKAVELLACFEMLQSSRCMWVSRLSLHLQSSSFSVQAWRMACTCRLFFVAGTEEALFCKYDHAPKFTTVVSNLHPLSLVSLRLSFR
jgi:hypothetical protein